MPHSLILSQSLIGSAASLNPDKLSLDLNFAAGSMASAVKKGPTPVFTRGSTATFVGSNGLIQNSSTHSPRFDYDPVNTGTCKGLLIEESRTNVITASSDFTNNWTNLRTNNSNVNTLNTIAPDGSNTADILLETAVTNTFHLDQFISSSYITSGKSYTASIFVKPNGRTFFSINSITGTSGVSSFCIFNLSGDGSFVSGYTGTPSIQKFNNGWYRVSLTSSVATSVAGGYIQLGIYLDGTTSSYPGDQTKGFYLWGAQFEEGLFPTSYIPTTSGALARSADVCSITGSAFTSFYNQSEGTVLSKSSQPFITTSNAQVYTIDNGSDTERFNLRHQSSFFVSQVAGVTKALISSTAPSANSISSFAIAYKISSYKGSLNSVLLSSTSGDQLSVPTVDRIYLGSKGNNSSEYLNGHIKSFSIYKKRLLDAKLQTLTA